MTLQSYLEESTQTLQRTAQQGDLMKSMTDAIQLTVTALRSGLPLLVCGNGGSASDAQHIAGELVGRFLKERQAYNVICLADNAAILTAVANDYDYDQVFSRQVQGYGKSGGVILGLSTSGHSANVINALKEAKSMGMTTIAMTGETGGQLSGISDVLLAAPSTKTPQIQQVHLCLYHYFCCQVEVLLTANASQNFDNIKTA